MTTASRKSRCAVCLKEKAILRCGGCSKDFCYNHVVDHRQELGKQLDEVELTRDIFRQTLTEQGSRPPSQRLMKQIDQWESTAITRIHQTAEETRKLLAQHSSKHVTEIESQLNLLTDQLRRSRRDDDFFETDLVRWKNELARLTKMLQTSPAIFIRQDSGVLVNRVVIEMQTDEQPVPTTAVPKPPDTEAHSNDLPLRSPSAPRRPRVTLPPVPPTFDDSDDDTEKRQPSSIPPDITEYRNHYPHARSNPKITDNYNFYTDKVSSRPDGDFIDNIHRKWFGDVKKLEAHHAYVDWLFPLQEKEPGGSAEPLQRHEIEGIKKDKKALKRLLESYKLMLDFYGFELVDEKTGELRRLPDNSYKSRFHNLNTSPHNHSRITRILKCLGEFDYEYLKFAFLEAILFEGIIANTLPNCLSVCQDYWIETLRSRQERRAIRQYARELLEYRNKGTMPSRAHRPGKSTSVHTPILRLKNPTVTKNTTHSLMGT